MKNALSMTSCPFVELAGEALRLYHRIPGRVQMFLSHISDGAQQPIEYKAFLHLLHASDYISEYKDKILEQQIICYNVGGADESDRTNLIIYTVDDQGVVTRWGCYYRGEEPRRGGSIDDFQESIPILQKRRYEFIPPGV